MKPRLIKYRKEKCGGIDFDELTFFGRNIGTTTQKREFRITKFRDDKDIGFFLNSTTQGNFVLNSKQLKTLKDFLNSGLKNDR